MARIGKGIQMGLSWVPAAGGTVPKNAIDAGNGVYICRAKVGTALALGKVVSTSKKATLIHDEREQDCALYEVLCETGLPNSTPCYEWEEAEAGHVHKYAIIGGRSSNGKPLYIARTQVDNEITVGMEASLKPSIVRQLAARDNGTEVQLLEKLALSDRLTSSDDVIFVEDDAQRIKLDFGHMLSSRRPTTPAELMTGIPVAVLGVEPESEPGVFHVAEVCFLEPKLERPIGMSKPTEVKCANFRSTGPWLGLVSGLGFLGDDCSSMRADHVMALDLLADWLRCAGDFEGTSQAGIGVVHLMILGDSIGLSCNGSGGAGQNNSGVTSLTRQALYLTRNVEAASVSAMAQFDSWLSTLPIGRVSLSSAPLIPSQVSGFSVDVLPGPCDPTSRLLPQQPIHPATLPRSLKYAGGRCGGLIGRTNPFTSRVADRELLVTSGQGVNDLARLLRAVLRQLVHLPLSRAHRFSELGTACDRMEATLLWGHLAPSCPDTLPAYPMFNEDLLLLDNAEYPDVYAAGCQPGSAPNWRRAAVHWNERGGGGGSSPEGALLVAVPRFDVSFCMVLVHLESLECRCVRFAPGLDV